MQKDVYKTPFNLKKKTDYLICKTEQIAEGISGTLIV